jgi:TRAP-type C4-dicarboxylate transport system substrate-binding protein
MKLKYLVAAGFAAAVATTGATAQEVTLRLHHFLPAPAPAHAKFMAPWAEKVEKESNGRIKVQLFPSMQLGGTPPQLFDQVKDGVVDIVWTLPGYTAGRFPIVEVFELPFMMQNTEATSRAVWEYVQQYDQAEFKDVKPLAFHVHGPGVFHMVKREVKSMSDLRGLKVRAPTRQTNKLLATLGATPVGMPVPQVPEALSKGVIDGTLIPYEVVPAIKVHEIVKFHSETDSKEPAIYTSVFLFAMNKAKYDGLSADLKRVIDANSGIELSAQVGRVFREADTPGKNLSSRNPINVIPAAEIQKWKTAAQPVIDGWVQEVSAKGADGKALLASARGLIAKHSK